MVTMPSKEIESFVIEKDKSIRTGKGRGKEGRMTIVCTMKPACQYIHCDIMLKILQEPERFLLVSANILVLKMHSTLFQLLRKHGTISVFFQAHSLSL